MTPPSAANAPSASDVFLLHGVMGPSATPEPPRDVLDRGPVHLVQVGEFLAIASSLPALLPNGRAAQDLLHDEDDVPAIAAAHHRILAALAGAHDVAPVRLGAICADPVALARAVQDQAPALAATLARIAGAGEYIIQVLDDRAKSARAQPASAAPSTSRPAPPPAPGGRAYLTARRAHRDARRTAITAVETVCSTLSAELEAIARVHQVTPRRPNYPERKLDMAILLPKADEPRLAAILAAHLPQAEAAGLRLKASGPWPAYSFAVTPASEPPDAHPRAA